MDSLAAIGDPGLRAALQFARAQAQPVTAEELAAGEGVHRNVARSRLERLLSAGLLTAAYENRSGRSGPGAGRPAKTYSVAPELSALQFPVGRYDELILLLTGALPARDRAARVRAVGAALAHRLAAAGGLRAAQTSRAALERVCEALRRLGYQAGVVEADNDGGVIETATCPLRPLVRRSGDLAELDRGMWAAFAEAALARATTGRVSCETHACQDDTACRVRITFA
jgi:predicted ArsR family transcriptional regulator